MPSVFISYSRTNISRAREIVGFLTSAEIGCWLDESGIPVGQAFVQHLGTAMADADSYLLLDSLQSRSSYWVQRELMTAARYRTEGRYHSLIRLFEQDCRETREAIFDLSLPLSEPSMSDLASYISQRKSEFVTISSGSDRNRTVFLNGKKFGQPEYWTGRQSDLSELDAWWHSSARGLWISGVGGIGKSGLLQTWITALESLGYRSPESVVILYYRGSEIDLNSGLSHIHARALENRGASALVVVDGYDETRAIESAERVILSALQSEARVLVSSRTQAEPILKFGFSHLSLSTFTRRDSLAALSDLTATEVETNALAEATEDFPLALLQIRALLQHGRLSASEALDQLRATTRDLIEGSGRSDRTKSIEATLDRSLGQLTPEARSLLQELCRDVRDPSILVSSLPGAAEELTSAGLIRLSNAGGSMQVDIHDLIRAYILRVDV